MLKRFTVRGARSFEGEVTLDFSNVRDYKFNTGHVRKGAIFHALLIGRNASGKTNFGRLMMDIRRNIDGAYSESMLSDVRSEFDPLYLNADNADGSARFEYVFQFGKTELEYSYVKSSPSQLLNERLIIDGEVVFDYDAVEKRMLDANLESIGAEGLNWQYSDDYLCLLAYFANVVPSDRMGLLKQLRTFVMNMKIVLPDGQRGRDDRNRILAKAIKYGCISDLQRFLERFGVREHLVVHPEPDGSKSIYCSHSQRDIPFAEACSSGTDTLLTLFDVFELSKSMSLVFLDEFDAYCHFEAAEALLQYLSERVDCQTICTTHNISLVKNATTRPDCVFQIDRTRGVRSLADSTDRELRLGNNIEKLLRSGEFE